MRCGENRRGSSGQQEGNDDSSLLKSINIYIYFLKPSHSFEYLIFHPFSESAADANSKGSRPPQRVTR